MNTKMKRSTATWIWDFAGEYRSRYVLSVLSAVCGVICGISPYFVMANMIGDLLGGCRDTNIYLQHCLVMALLWVVRCGFHSISTTLSHKATFAVLGNIRKRVCEKLTRVPLGTVLDAAGKVGHIFDPVSGRPAAGPWRQVSVSARSAAVADALSTAACLMPDRAAIEAACKAAGDARLEQAIAA